MSTASPFVISIGGDTPPHSGERARLVGHLAGHASSVHTEAVAMALPGPTLRRHWGLRLAASLGAVLCAVTVSGVLLRVVSVEYLRAPVTGWFIWASVNSVRFLGH